ncbi:SDR family oxidoreductase [Stieleria varia]|uniref:NAD-dependent epimerase/dehydratase domain-containing protein n=1 Tax=Stieleria varia TaxID=2528005 RepID=A0A5C5ZX81_9BACT|nr:SDR family oxidoreductase [Stieleria varia]TWT91577.1 hypothetical protein Pla52n_65680 [Stieleria varia]
MPEKHAKSVDLTPKPGPEHTDDPSGVLIVGCGYLGAEVARMAAERGFSVWATTRSPDRARQFESLGWNPVVCDWTLSQTLANLPKVDRVLVAVSYDRASGLDRYDSQVGGLRNLLAVLPTQTRLCYISTTGVYHQTDGRWVDETSPTHPGRLGGSVHLAAEQQLHRDRPLSPWMVLRLAGIYGIGRVPRARDVIRGKPIQSPAEGYLNLIHVHDAARCVMAAWDKMSGANAPWHPTLSRRLYAVADDCPMPRGEFYREIARQTGSPMPRFESPPPGSSISMRSESNKRIWNRRMKSDLLPRLQFPDYRCGLASVLPSVLQ